MPEVDAATSQATTTEGTEAELDALLGGEGNDGGSSAATEEVEAGEPQTETETEEAETGDESGEEGESTEADPGEESEEETETEEGAEDEGDEESELTFDENDRDYSDAAYEKAAKVYSKNLKVQFDPKDPKDRAVLREMMQRKEAFERMKAQETSATEEDEGTEEVAKPTQTEAPTAEQIADYLARNAAVAEKRVVPQVAMHVATKFVNAMWPGKNVKVTQEQANGITSFFQEMFQLAMDDAAPTVFQMVNQGLRSDPVYGRVGTIAVRENAFELLDSQKNEQGQPRYPDLERMATSGMLKRVMAKNAWISQIKAGDGRDEVKNYAAQIDAAYKIAKGEQVNPAVVKKAVQTGRKLATDNAKRVAAGRVASGKTKGGFSTGPSDAEKAVNDLVSEGGSRFADAVANSVSLRRNR